MTAVDHRLTMAGVRARRAMTLRWEISPRAIRHAPVPAIAAMNGQAEKIATARLEWQVNDDRAIARLVLEIGEDDVVIPLADVRGAWVVDAIGGCAHGEFGEVLAVTVRNDAIMYARTRILSEALGLSGGVYDSPRGG